MKTLNELAAEAHANAVSKGWWDEDRSFGEVIALIHSEVSEALEFYREGHAPDELFYTKEGTKPDGIPAEFADIIIRIFDAAGKYNIDLDTAVVEKMLYNKSRSFKHGGKVI